MGLLKSIFTGKSGCYEVWGIPISFQERLSNINFDIEDVSHKVQKLFWAVFGVTEGLFIHEMCHIIVAKCLGVNVYKVVVVTIPLRHGGATYIPTLGQEEGWKEVAIYAAGPIGHMAYRVCELGLISILMQKVEQSENLIVRLGVQKLCKVVLWRIFPSLYIEMGHASAFLVEYLIGKEENDFAKIGRISKGALAVSCGAVVGLSILSRRLIRKIL